MRTHFDEQKFFILDLAPLIFVDLCYKKHLYSEGVLRNIKFVVLITLLKYFLQELK